MERRKEEGVKEDCTVKPNKVVFRDLCPCAVELCCGSKCSERALPQWWLGARSWTRGQHAAAQRCFPGGFGLWLSQLRSTGQPSPGEGQHWEMESPPKPASARCSTGGTGQWGGRCWIAIEVCSVCVGVPEYQFCCNHHFPPYYSLSPKI